MKHFIVICEYCCDGESGVDIITVKHTYEEALTVFQKQMIVEKQNAENNGYDCIDEEENSFVAYADGEYCLDHIQLYIQGVEG